MDDYWQGSSTKPVAPYATYPYPYYGIHGLDALCHASFVLGVWTLGDRI